MSSDLIGKSWTNEEGVTYTVTEPCPWSEQYVHVRASNLTSDTPIIKPVSVVRRHLEILDTLAESA